MQVHMTIRQPHFTKVTERCKFTSGRLIGVYRTTSLKLAEKESVPAGQVFANMSPEVRLCLISSQPFVQEFCTVSAESAFSPAVQKIQQQTDPKKSNYTPSEQKLTN